MGKEEDGGKRVTTTTMEEEGRGRIDSFTRSRTFEDCVKDVIQETPGEVHDEDGGNEETGEEIEQAVEGEEKEEEVMIDIIGEMG